MKGFYEYLKKPLLIHIMTGLLLGLSIGFLIFTDSYKKPWKEPFSP